MEEMLKKPEDSRWKLFCLTLGSTYVADKIKELKDRRNTKYNYFNLLLIMANTANGHTVAVLVAELGAGFTELRRRVDERVRSAHGSVSWWWPLTVPLPGVQRFVSHIVHCQGLALRMRVC